MTLRSRCRPGFDRSDDYGILASGTQGQTFTSDRPVRGVSVATVNRAGASMTVTLRKDGPGGAPMT